MKQSKSVYSLIPLDDFKALLGIDDREEPLARFCLTIATHPNGKAPADLASACLELASWNIARL